MIAAQTEQILNHHFDAFDRQNLTDLMADYAEDAVLLYHQNRYQGLTAIRAFFDDFMHNQLPPESHFELLHIQIIENLGYIVWQAQTPIQNFEFATDTFIIKNGKIQQQTFACLVKN